MMANLKKNNHTIRREQQTRIALVFVNTYETQEIQVAYFGSIRAQHIGLTVYEEIMKSVEAEESLGRLIPGKQKIPEEIQ